MLVVHNEPNTRDLAVVALRAAFLEAVGFEDFLLKRGVRIVSQLLVDHEGHGLVAGLDTHFLDLAEQEHAGDRLVFEAGAGRFVVARPLTALKVFRQADFLDCIEVVAGFDRLAIDRAVVALCTRGIIA